MRQPLHIVRYLVILLALTFAARAYADDRADARAHYQAGVKAYGSGDYRAAIREFSSAQQIAPADLNNYNLALCYDKLGDAEPAVQYYRAFLDRQPNTDKRGEIEASISRLEAALKSAASKKEAAKPVPPPAEVAPAPAPGPVLGPAAPPTAAAPAAPQAPVMGPPAPGQEPAAPAKKKGVAVAGSIGTPSSGQAAPSGDAQLDRVQQINIDEIRDQRAGRSGGGPAVAANDPQGPDAQPPMNSGSSASGPAPITSNNGNDQPVAHKETPVYKKWWFWAVVAVSGYVAYELVTADSKSTRDTGRPGRTGLTLFSW